MVKLLDALLNNNLDIDLKSVDIPENGDAVIKWIQDNFDKSETFTDSHFKFLLNLAKELGKTKTWKHNYSAKEQNKTELVSMTIYGLLRHCQKYSKRTDLLSFIPPNLIPVYDFTNCSNNIKYLSNEAVKKISGKQLLNIAQHAGYVDDESKEKLKLNTNYNVFSNNYKEDKNTINTDTEKILDKTEKITTVAAVPSTTEKNTDVDTSLSQTENDTSINLSTEGKSPSKNVKSPSKTIKSPTETKSPSKTIKSPTKTETKSPSKTIKSPTKTETKSPSITIKSPTKTETKSPAKNITTKSPTSSTEISLTMATETDQITNTVTEFMVKYDKYNELQPESSDVNASTIRLGDYDFNVDTILRYFSIDKAYQVNDEEYNTLKSLEVDNTLDVSQLLGMQGDVASRVATFQSVYNFIIALYLKSNDDTFHNLDKETQNVIIGKFIELLTIVLSKTKDSLREDGVFNEKIKLMYNDLVYISQVLKKRLVNRHEMATELKSLYDKLTSLITANLELLNNIRQEDFSKDNIEKSKEIEDLIKRVSGEVNSLEKVKTDLTTQVDNLNNHKYIPTNPLLQPVK
jgi:hypothetical protein